MAYFISILVFLSVTLFILGLSSYLSDRKVILLVKQAKEALPEKLEECKGFSISRDIIHPLLKKLSTLNERVRFPLGYKEKLKRRLSQAGSPGDLGVNEFIVLKEIGAISFPLIVRLIFNLSHPGIIFISILLGFFFPDRWLKEKVTIRKKTILRTLPYTLDLITACVEAGLSFDAALARIMERSKLGPLKDEIRLTLQEIRVGKTRQEAFKDMAKRIDLPEFSSVVAAVIQGEELGTSIGSILRSQADHIRIMRTQRIEKLAAEAPFKLLFPLVIFIFPVVFIMLFGPVLLQLLQGF